MANNIDNGGEIYAWVGIVWHCQLLPALTLQLSHWHRVLLTTKLCATGSPVTIIPPPLQNNPVRLLYAWVGCHCMVNALSIELKYCLHWHSIVRIDSVVANNQALCHGVTHYKNPAPHALVARNSSSIA